MINSIADNSIYMTIKEISQITRKSITTLKDRCLKNKYVCRQVLGNGGKQYEILVSSLEVELQDKIYAYLNNYSLAGDNIYTQKEAELNPARFSLNLLSDGSENNQNIVKLSTNAPVFLNSFCSYLGGGLPPMQKSTAPFSLAQKVIPDKAKKLALAKVDLIQHWEAFRNGQKNKKQADIDFLELYNSKVLSRSLYSVIGKVSKATLYRWNKDLKDNNNDYTALIPNYNYGSESVVNTKMTLQEQNYLMDLMLRPAKMSVGNAYRLIEYVLKKQNITEIASYSTYKRFVQKFKRNNYDIWILMREGQKALIDKVAPYIKRNPALLEVGDVLIADGHTLDFMVINPFTGRPCRPTIVVYQDWKSADIAGYEIMVSENTQCIASALRNSIIRLGKTPKICYQDNGKAFRGEFFTGSNSFEESGFYGVFGSLGIVPVFAKPYNGKAKAVERFFREFTQTFSSLVPSYIGNCIENRPAYEKRNEKFHKQIHSDFVPTIQQTVSALEEWLKFYRSQPCPHAEGKTIGEVFNEGRGVGVDINKLDDLMMTEEIRKVGRNGIKMFNTFYYSPKLYGLKDNVIVKYSLLNINSVRIYSLCGEFICEAEMLKDVHPMARLMGDNNDVYAYKQALKAVQTPVKNTLKDAKKLVPYLQNRVEWQDIKPEKEIKTDKVKPIKASKKYKITCCSEIVPQKTYQIM